MKVVYALQKFPDSWTKCIFLAGPTPRSPDVLSWRVEAIRFLEERGFDGVVISPEPRIYQSDWLYEPQVDWETEGLSRADCILFWIPRDIALMPAFTTNHEHGEWFKSGKIILGAPSNAPRMSYLRYKAKQFFVPQSNTLEGTIDATIKFIGDGVMRTGGETWVPLYIWRTPSFQKWYEAHKSAGNRLDRANIEWVFRVGREKNRIYAWAMRVDVFVASENRHKTNEVVIARPDISTVLMYRLGDQAEDHEIVLVREFRSPVQNSQCFIYELPGGSSFDPMLDHRAVASSEVREETGLSVEPGRFLMHESRQLAGTFSAHHANLFSVELSADEVRRLRGQVGVVHGIDASCPDSTGERTYVEVHKLGDILSENLVDWSTLGMIFSVLKNR